MEVSSNIIIYYVQLFKKEDDLLVLSHYYKVKHSRSALHYTFLQVVHVQVIHLDGGFAVSEEQTLE